MEGPPLVANTLGALAQSQGTWGEASIRLPIRLPGTPEDVEELAVADRVL